MLTQPKLYKVNWPFVRFMYVSIEKKCDACVTNVDLTNNENCLAIVNFEFSNSGWGPGEPATSI